MSTTDVHLDLIDRVRVASPCPVKWEDLDGDGATRHCRQCNLDVHDFSEMSRAEVEDLIRNRDGRLCGTFFRRADGTVLTKDCPVGLRAVRIRTAKLIGRVAAAVGLLLAGAAVLGRDRDPARTARLRAVQPFSALSNLVDPVSPPPGPMIAGEICVTPQITNAPGPPANPGETPPVAPGSPSPRDGI